MDSLHTRFEVIGRGPPKKNKVKNSSATAAAAYVSGSAVAAAFYRAQEKGQRMEDGKIHDYTRKSGVAFTKIFLPSNVPAEFGERSFLWNSAEARENRKNSRLAYQWQGSFPVEFSREEQIEMMSDFIENHFTYRGIAADFAIHDKGDGNPHFHIMLTTRQLDENGWVKNIDRTFNQFQLKGKKSLAEQLRDDYSAELNRRYQEMGLPERDYRSYEKQQNGLTPTMHLGKKVHHLQKRGIETEIGRKNSEIRSANKLVLQNQLYDNIIELANSRGERQLEFEQSGAAGEAGMQGGQISNVVDSSVELSPQTRAIDNYRGWEFYKAPVVPFRTIDKYKGWTFYQASDNPPDERIKKVKSIGAKVGRKVLKVTDTALGALDKGVIQPTMSELVEPLIEQTIEPMMDDTARQFEGTIKEPQISNLSLPEIVDRLRQLRMDNRELSRMGRTFNDYQSKIENFEHVKSNLDVRNLGSSHWVDGQLQSLEQSNQQAKSSLSNEYGIAPEQINEQIAVNERAISKLDELRIELADNQRALERGQGRAWEQEPTPSRENLWDYSPDM